MYHLTPREGGLIILIFARHYLTMLLKMPSLPRDAPAMACIYLRASDSLYYGKELEQGISHFASCSLRISKRADFADT